MAIIGIIILTVFMISWDVPKMVSGKQWRELAVYTVFLLFGVGSAMALALGLKLPNTTKLIRFVYHPVAAFVDKILS